MLYRINYGIGKVGLSRLLLETGLQAITGKMCKTGENGRTGENED
jgi:hypothetical protein